MDFIAQLLQMGEQSDIWCYVAGSSSTGQNNFLSQFKYPCLSVV